jgi:hypothetical protein
MEQEQNTPRGRTLHLVTFLVPGWQPNRVQVQWAIRILILFVVLLGVLALISLPFGISLWGWVKLVIVPVVIAAVGIWFNRQQQRRELEVAEQRAQDEALQAYLDWTGNLLFDKDPPGGFGVLPPRSKRWCGHAR